MVEADVEANEGKGGRCRSKHEEGADKGGVRRTSSSPISRFSSIDCGGVFSSPDCGGVAIWLLQKGDVHLVVEKWLKRQLEFLDEQKMMGSIRVA